MEFKIVDGVFKNEYGETPEQYSARMSGVDKIQKPQIPDSSFTIVNGEWRNSKNETVNDYKVRVMTETGVDLTNFKIVNCAVRNNNYETVEEYLSRLDRNTKYGKDVKNRLAVIQQEEQRKLNKKKRIKRLLKVPKKILKWTAIGVATIAATFGFYYAGLVRT